MPKENVELELQSIYRSLLGTSKPDTKLTDINSKFNLLKTCEEKIGHSVPSALLHSMQTLEDVTTFFKTPVDVRTPYEKLKDMELPDNLHVQFEYHRFQDCKLWMNYWKIHLNYLFLIVDTDQQFKVTAFPGSSTIVTGIKYKEKYRGHVAPNADEEYKPM